MWKRLAEEIAKQLDQAQQVVSRILFFIVKKVILNKVFSYGRQPLEQRECKVHQRENDDNKIKLFTP